MFFNLSEFLKAETKKLKTASQYRKLIDINKYEQHLTVTGTRMVNLSSNDYLSIGSNRSYINEFMAGIEADKQLLGATSSRLLTGNVPEYELLENKLCMMYNSEAALVFNSGYHANTGILPAIMKRGDLILSDRLNHASIVDGLRLSAADFERYKHLDYVHLEKILQKKRHQYAKVCIVSESVFSMDGDVADLQKLVDLKKKYNVFLYIDEAHAVGVFGENGLGCCEAQNATADIEIIVGTFGKAYSSVGAFAILNKLLRDFLINTVRTLIFTTALPRINLLWTSFVMDKIIADEKQNRKKLHELAGILQKMLIENGFGNISQSHICPLIAGSNEQAIKLADKLKENGFWVSAIRPPTVPAGTARIRISLTPAVSVLDLEHFIEVAFSCT